MRRPSVGVIAAVGLVALGVIGYLPTNEVSIREGKQLLLEWGGWVLVAGLIGSPWLRAFVRWSALTTILRYNALSFFAMTQLLSGGLMIEALARALRAEDLPRVLTGLRVITLLQLAWMGLQQLGLDPLFAPVEDYGHRVLYGFLDNSRIAGLLLAMMLPLFLRGRWRWGLLALVPAILATRSVGVALTGAVVLLIGWRIWYRPSWGLMVCAGAVLSTGIGAVFGAHLWSKLLLESVGARVPVWSATWELITLNAKTCFLGWGMGQFAAAYKGIVDAHHIAPNFLNWQHPHNEYLLVWFNQGLLGLVLMGGYGVGLMRDLRRRWEEIGPEAQALTLVVVGWLVAASWWFATTPGLLVVLLVAVGALEGVRRRGDPRSVARMAQRA